MMTSEDFRRLAPAAQVVRDEDDVRCVLGFVRYDTHGAVMRIAYSEDGGEIVPCDGLTVVRYSSIGAPRVERIDDIVRRAETSDDVEKRYPRVQEA